VKSARSLKWIPPINGIQPPLVGSSDLKTRLPGGAKVGFSKSSWQWSKLCCKFEKCTLGVRHMTRAHLSPYLGRRKKKLDIESNRLIPEPS